MTAVLVTGFLVSFGLWAALSLASLAATLRLHRDKAITEKWLLLAPFLFASLVFCAIRYRFVYFGWSHDAVYSFFSIGAFWQVDRLVLVACLPLYYMISVLRPQWVVQVRVNLPLLVIFPFALKLALYLSGAVDWDPHPGKIMPTRLE